MTEARSPTLLIVDEGTDRAPGYRALAEALLD